MKIPKVSVILPCYNVSKFMDPMFTSLRNQTLKDIEIICVDDKSSDDTAYINGQWLHEYFTEKNLD